MRIVPFLPVLFFLNACATPAISPNLFLTPESKGEAFHGDFHGGITSVATIQTTPGDSINPQYADPSVTNGGTVLAGGELGLLESLDVFVNDASGAPCLFGIKGQFIGSSERNAEAGNFSVAAAAAAAFGSASSRPEAAQDTTTVQYSGWQALLLFGYRPVNSLVLYANPFWSHLKAAVQVSTDSNVSINPDGVGDTYGLTLGGRWTIIHHLFVAAEVSLAETSWTRTFPTSSTGNGFNALPGAVGGFAW